MGYSANKSPAKYPSNNGERDALPIKYEVIVIDSLKKKKESQNMTFCQQLSFANLLRERGNLRYEKQRFETALNLYLQAIQCLDAMKDLGMSMPNELEATKVSEADVAGCAIKCYLNFSICHRRMEQHNECIAYTTKALKINSQCTKALIRRALSYYDTACYDLAKNDMLRFQELAKNQKQQKLIKKYLKKVQSAKQKQIKKQKKNLWRFFGCKEWKKKNHIV